MLQHVDQLVELITLENSLDHDYLETPTPELEEVCHLPQYHKEMEDGVVLIVVADKENETFHVYTEAGLAQASVKYDDYEIALEEVQIYADRKVFA